jgi:acyl-CoA dehydrogenase
MAHPATQKNSFRSDLGELRFVLWSQLKLGEQLAALGTYQAFSSDVIERFLDSAKRFADEYLGPAYQAADREGCRMLENGRVEVPSIYRSIWRTFIDQGWTQLGQSPGIGGLGAPFILCQAVNELLFGADPSFMIYSGFGVPVAQLIEKYGSRSLVEKFCPRIAQGEWTACLCMTEPDAGSDLALIRTMASRLDDGTYRITGDKIFVSGGAHDLTENIVYLVLARPKDAPQGLRGLSLFLVPHRWASDSGELIDNGVGCLRIESKMGLHGSCTAHLRFGNDRECRGYLVGANLYEGMVQLRSVMNQARISTGIYALGMASSAYLHAVEYAKERVQGTELGQSINPRAARVPIIEHVDVRRMLVEMQSKVEGMRALILRLAWYQTIVESSSLRGGDDEVSRQRKLVDLLTPLAKAYVSDQAWRICELAIQVHGGVGYLRDYPLEQYARDVKILSIWEGTNYIQAVDLLHGKLRVGNQSAMFDLLVDEMQSVRTAAAVPQFQHESQMLEAAIAAVRKMFVKLQEYAKCRKLEEAHAHATRFLESVSEVVTGWLLMEGAIIAKDKLASNKSGDGDVTFYERKLASARYYMLNVLPAVIMKSQLTETAYGTVPRLH